MAGYRELRDGYEFTTSYGSSTGQRVFIEYTGESGSLPSLGDSFSAGYPECTCTSIKEALYHTEASGTCKDRKKYVCSYATGAGQSVTLVGKQEDDQFINSGGQELVAVPEPNEFYWVPEAWNVFTDGKFKDKLYKNTIRGSISKTILLQTTGSHSFANFMDEQVFKKLGKINAEELTAADWSLNFTKGTLLLSNFDSSLVRTNSGAKRWQVTLNFAYRILQIPEAAGQNINGVAVDGEGNNVPYSWNYYINTKKYTGDYNQWQMCATRSEGDPVVALDFDDDYVYKTSEFMGASGNFNNILGEY